MTEDHGTIYQFDVEGMTCAACVTNVEQALGKIAGVGQVSVNLALESASLEADGEVQIEELRRAVARAGYTLNPAGKASLIERQQQNLARWGRLLLIQVIFGAPLILLAMLEMLGLFPWMSSPAGIGLQLGLASILVITGRGYYLRGARHLLVGAPNMDSLIMLGTGAAFLFSTLSALNTWGHWNWPVLDHFYFEAVGAILLFITLGKWLEAIARGKTTEALSGLSENMPRTAQVFREGKWLETPLEQVVGGDRIRVLPHSRIPVDGSILEGSGYVDESAISGESIPVEHGPGDKVLSATLNLERPLIISAEHFGRESVYGQIIQLVEDAQGRKPAIQQLADRISAVFVPVVLGLALLAGGTWMLLGYGFPMAFQTFISVLIIACPCALGLATPTAIVMGSGLMARAGIILKNPDALQNLNGIDTLIFDKTGSLTLGKPALVEHWSANGTRALELAAGLEAQATHPLALALREFVEAEGILPATVDGIEQVPGRGIQGVVDGTSIAIGKLNDDLIIPDPVQGRIEKWREAGFSLSAVLAEGEVLGILAFSDPLRPAAREAVVSLQEAGVESEILSGDHAAAVAFAAREAGIREAQGGLLPGQKHERIMSLQTEGKKVGMLGDGINDAPALVAADVGLSFSTGTDIAVNAADIIFLNNSLNQLLTARRFARATMGKIRQNLFWAFFYNVIGIPIAMGVLYPVNGLLLNPMFAGLAMAFSSVSVVSNTLLLKLQER